MRADRDGLWADLLQFDPPAADRVWDGDLRDPDAPSWYADLGSLIHRARGPAEADELVDEPVLVATMRRASLGAAIVGLPRRRGVRQVGRVVAMKAAAAATTASMVGVAAAATTGIVATMAATVVVPAINEKVRPVIEAHVVPITPAQTPDGASTSASTEARPPLRDACTLLSEMCPSPSAPVVVEASPAVPVPVTAPEAPAADVSNTATAAPPVEPAVTPPATEAPVVTPTPDPAPPAETPPAETPPAETPPADPPAEPDPTIVPLSDAPPAEPAPTAEPAADEPAPAPAAEQTAGLAAADLAAADLAAAEPAAGSEGHRAQPDPAGLQVAEAAHADHVPPGQDKGPGAGGDAGT